jgi:hypothetical protein
MKTEEAKEGYRRNCGFLDDESTLNVLAVPSKVEANQTKNGNINNLQRLMVFCLTVCG